MCLSIKNTVQQLRTKRAETSAIKCKKNK